MTDSTQYPRFAAARLREALADSPAVLIHGPRQAGKSTLAQMVGAELGYAHVTFDDAVPRRAADEDPTGFVDALPPRVILDEVQRVPHLFTALKAAIDRDRRAGRFLLTGSANVLLVPGLADSLAGRMEILRLHPLAQCELAGHEAGFLDLLFSATPPLRQRPRLGDDLARRMVDGGFPAALARAMPARRRAWYRDYLEAIVQRDVRELAQIRALDVLPRLLAATAAQTARLLNVSDLAAPFAVSRPTIAEYLALLERVFLVETLPAWHDNRLSRLVKTPKVHFGDTGTAAALLGVDADDLRADRALYGQFVETFVVQELRRQADWAEDPTSFFHFRDRDGYEVDLILARGRALCGVEVKAAASVAAADFRGLRKLRDAAGERFRAGLVLYDGEHAVPFGDRLYALPLRAIWEPGDTLCPPRLRH